MACPWIPGSTWVARRGSERGHRFGSSRPIEFESIASMGNCKPEAGLKATCQEAGRPATENSVQRGRSASGSDSKSWSIGDRVI